MNSLQGAFRLFAASLETDLLAKEQVAHPLASELLADYADNPRFWLQYAVTCYAQEDYQEASIALETMGKLLAEQRETIACSPGQAPVLAALLWWRLKCYTELLKMVARGNPSVQAALISNLKGLIELSHEGIGIDLAEAQSMMDDSSAPGQEADAKWAQRLRRLATIHVPGYDTDLNVIQDLATALMGSARYAEAEQLFKELPFSSFVALDEASERKRRWHPLLIHWLRTFLQDPFRHVAPFTTPGHRYVLAMVVWGDAFLDSLERFALPSLLAEGNLPYLQGTGEVHFLFFTPDAGAMRLERMPVFQAVKRIVSVDVVTFPKQLTDPCDIYKLMSTLHLASMEVAKASQSHFFFLAPDIVVADNFLQVVDQRMRQGAEVVFVPGLMLQLETFGEEQAQRFPPVQQVLSIPPRDLLDLGMRHIHPFVKQTYTYSPIKRRPSASVILWPLASGGYLAHGFHHTPYLVSARAMERFDGSLFFTIDGEFLLKIIRSQEELERCVLITDAQETNYFELSKGSRFDFPLEFDMARTCRWGALQGIVAKWLFRQKVCFDPGGMGSSDPDYQASTLVVEEILRGMEREEQGIIHLPMSVEVP